MRTTCPWLTTLLLLAAACADNPTSLDPANPAVLVEQRAGAAPRLTVLTRNLYVGADVDAVIGALASPDPGDDLPALQAAIGTLQRTDFPTRARAIAGEIARTRPDVIGLQEVSEIHVDLTTVGMPVTIDLDFLAILQAELAARRLPYVVAAKVRNTDAAPVPFIRLVDFDVLLVNAERVTVDPGPLATNFAFNIGAVAPGVSIKRGYIMAGITTGGSAYTVVTTHLESGSDPQLAQLRAAQAMELVAVIGASRRVVLLGDLNDVPGSAMTQVLAGAGLRDAWAVMRPNRAGLTCCNLPDLSNPQHTFTQRIDYVWERGLELPNGELAGDIQLLGQEPGDRIAGPAGLIWPSDHAGVAAGFTVAK